MKKILSLIISLFLIGSCGLGNMDTTYQPNDIGQMGSVLSGVIVAMQAAQIQGEDTLGEIAGGVAGAAAGSMIGGDIAVNVIGGVGGALVGGALGGELEKEMTKDTAYQFFVKLDETGKVVSVIQTNELHLRIGDRVLLIDTNGTIHIQQKFKS